MMRLLLVAILLLLGCTEQQLVAPVPVDHLDPGLDTLHLSPQESLTVAVIPRDEAGNQLYDRAITFASTAPAFAEVDSLGVVTAVAAGSGGIVLTSEGATDTLPFRVVSSWVGGSLGDATYGPGCLLRPDRRAWCFGPYVGGSIPTPRASAVTFREIDAGYMHICGIAADSTGWCWGTNADYAIQNAPLQNHISEPVEQIPGARFRSLSAGYEHTCGVLIDGTGLCWGHNDVGQRGDSTHNEPSVYDTIVGGHIWKAIGAGDHWTCGIDEDGQPWCWGSNTVLSSLGGETSVPVAIPGTPTLVSIEVGGDFACGQTSVGITWCWGANGDGQLGHSGGPGAGVVVTTTIFQQLALGYNEVCGLDSDGAAWCWGHGGYTGDGTWESHQEPTRVVGGHRFVALAGGWPGFCGFTAGGAAWCWGGMNFWSTHALVPRRVWDP